MIAIVRQTVRNGLTEDQSQENSYGYSFSFELSTMCVLPNQSFYEKICGGRNPHPEKKTNRGKKRLLDGGEK